jgi:hypothetical protein
MGEKPNLLEFECKTGKIIIDYGKCIAPVCGFACVKGDRYYGRNVLKIEDGRPVLATGKQEAKSLCNECIACEIQCEFYGGKAIRLELPLFGIEEYRGRFERLS